MRELPTNAERGEHTRHDPDYAPNVEIFDNLTHRRIHAGVQLLDPAALSAGQQAWQGSATGVADAVSQAHTEIRALIADGWRGGAARTAAEAVRSFEQHGQQLADVMSVVAQRLGHAGDAAETLRGAVGAPTADTPDLSAALLDPSQATANSATQKAAEHERGDVVRAMDSVYTNAFIRSGTDVPAFPDSTPSDSQRVAGTATTAAAPTTPVYTASVPVNQPISDVDVAALATSVPEETSSRTEPVAAQATTAQAATVPASPVLTSAPHVVDPPSVPVSAQTAATTAQQAASTVPTPAPDRVTAPGSGVPTVPAAAAPVVAPTVPGAGAQSSTEEDRKRDERRRDTGGDAVNGMGAGAIGGLMGGALATSADNARSGSGIGSPQVNRTARSEEDEDDDLEWIDDDDDLTFLEPADEPDELIGALDPTTPPVVGDWTELE
ncbi:WXG100 family type VII secretion target [Nocardia sp. NBC_01377]|uniref:WXG100 family type VII secretion target n=1 Tax=Nocardia sp. NBC_01377 TaxID=2903595 RepID=UPI0032545180